MGVNRSGYGVLTLVLSATICQMPVMAQPLVEAGENPSSAPSEENSEGVNEPGKIMETIEVHGSKMSLFDELVDAATLEQIQANDLEDVFSLATDITVGGSVGVAQKIYVRGIEDEKLNVTIDGAMQSGSLFHHQGRLSIEPDLLKQVEVEVGTGDATSGPGALGGAIRFVTKDPGDLLYAGEQFGSSVKTAYFSNADGYEVTGSVYGEFHERLGVLATVAKADNDTMVDGNGDDIPGTQSEQTIGFVKLVSQLTDSQTLRVSYDRRDDEGVRQQRPEWGPSSFNPQYALEGERETVTANYEFDPAHNEWLKLDLTAYATEASILQNVVDRWGEYQGQVETTGFDLRNSSQWHRHKWVYGADYRRDESDAGSPGAPSAERFGEEATVAGLYVQDYFELNDAVSVSFGARYDRYDLTDAEDQSFEADGFSPNANIQYQVVPSLRLRAGYAEALRGRGLMGTFKLGGRSNDPDMTEERAKNTELGVVYETGGLSLQGEVFQSRILDAIGEAPPPEGGRPLYYNVGDIETEGFTFNAAYTWASLYASLGYNHTDGTLDGEDLNNYDSRGLGTSIGDTWVVRLDYSVGESVQMGWIGRFVQREEGIETSVGNVDKPGYGVSDVYLQVIPADLNNLLLTLTVNNLFDKPYRNHGSFADYQHIEGFEGIVGVNEPGRDVRVAVKYQF